MEEGFGFHVEWGIRTKNLRQDFFCGLHQALGPARLLRFEAVHVHGKFAGAFDFREVEKSPAFELRAVGEVGIFGERVVFPAAGGIDCRAAPGSSGAVEIEKSAAAGTCAMFDDEVTVEQNGFDLGEQRIRSAPCRFRNSGNREWYGGGNRIRG